MTEENKTLSDEAVINAQPEDAEAVFATLFKEAKKFQEAKKKIKANPKGTVKVSKNVQKLLDIEDTNFWSKRETENERISKAWKEKELVLIMHHCECKRCGVKYVMPNAHVLIALENDKIGRHMKKVSDIFNWQELYGHLPRRVEIFFSNSEFCGECFMGEFVEIPKHKALTAVGPLEEGVLTHDPRPPSGDGEKAESNLLYPGENPGGVQIIDAQPQYAQG